jgi:SAM-dependent methyltransferase
MLKAAAATRWVVNVTSAVALAVAAGGCEYRGALAQPANRTPDVRYEPTPQHIVEEMVKLARVGPNDVVFDLGCGDGRIVITAVKQRGARGVCVDIDPQRIEDSRANAQQSDVASRIQFLNQDLFVTDIGDATVVMLFLSQSVNLKLRPKLWRDLKPGVRVVSYVHDMADWTPEEARDVMGDHGPRKVFLWVVPEFETRRPK